MNQSLVIQVVTTVILKLAASSLFLTYFSQIFYTPVLQEDSSATPKDCPVSWQFFKGKCYFFSTRSQTWDESQQTCLQFSSHLAAVNSNEELMFLRSRIQSEKYFIGLTQKDRRWTWIDGTNFDPNLFVFNTRDFQCAVIGFSSINGASCSVGHRSICEKNA